MHILQTLAIVVLLSVILNIFQINSLQHCGDDFCAKANCTSSSTHFTHYSEQKCLALNNGSSHARYRFLPKHGWCGCCNWCFHLQLEGEFCFADVNQTDPWPLSVVCDDGLYCPMDEHRCTKINASSVAITTIHPTTVPTAVPVTVPTTKPAVTVPTTVTTSKPEVVSTVTTGKPTDPAIKPTVAPTVLTTKPTVVPTIATTVHH